MIGWSTDLLNLLAISMGLSWQAVIDINLIEHGEWPEKTQALPVGRISSFSTVQNIHLLSFRRFAYCFWLYQYRFHSILESQSLVLHPDESKYSVPLFFVCKSYIVFKYFFQYFPMDRFDFWHLCNLHWIFFKADHFYFWNNYTIMPIIPALS